MFCDGSQGLKFPCCLNNQLNKGQLVKLRWMWDHCDDPRKTAMEISQPHTDPSHLSTKQVSRAWISNYIPQILWDVTTHPCPRYLLLTHKSWILKYSTLNDESSISSVTDTWETMALQITFTQQLRSTKTPSEMEFIEIISSKSVIFSKRK